MKELFGRPLNLIDNMYSAFGYDYFWWLIPTKPCISINYFEKMYTVKEIKKLRSFDEDEYDVNRKIFADTIKKSKKDKIRFATVFFILSMIWLIHGKYLA
jgi:hypothetical protein